MAKTHDPVANGIDYAERVIAHKIDAPKYVRLACQRFERDYTAARAGDGLWTFDLEKARRPLQLCEKLPNIKGPYAGQPIELMGWQCWCSINITGFVERGTKLRRFRQASIWCPRGNGKALAIQTPIATPAGFTAMGDLRVGDLVIDRDGKPTRITRVSEVMLGHPCHAVRFSTGETIIADADHQWLTKSKKERENAAERRNPRRLNRYTGRTLGRFTGSTESAKTTHEIAATLHYGGKRERNHAVKMAQPLDLPWSFLPIDPWILGFWLGDGTSSAATITVGHEDLPTILAELNERHQNWTLHRSDDDDQSAGRIWIGESYRPNQMTVIVLLKTKLAALNLLSNKHIPPFYLRAAYEQRMDLLCGLIDSDGYISPQGQCEYVSIDRRLAEDTAELAASLGYRPTITAGRAKLYGRDISPKYRVTFHVYADRVPARLERKARNAATRKGHGYQDNRFIIAVDPVPSVPVRCIEVESPSKTYLVGRSFIPTHNSSWIAPLALYFAFADGEGGAEAYAAAVTRDQAKIVWETAWEMTRRSPRFRKLAGVETSVNSIFQERSASKFVPISSDSKGLEGLNVHFAVLDEVGSHKTGRVYDVILTGLGKRLQPMLVTISTATSNNTGVGKQLWNYTIKILERVLDDDRFFGVIYAADEGDDVWSERTMRKANPGWGITVVPEQVRMIARQAKNNPAQETIYKTRHLNIWVTGNQALFSLEHWRACKDESLSLEDFEGQPCILALDVANKVDLAAAVLVFWNEGDDGEDVYSVFAKTWLPEARVELVTAYAQWQKDGWLTVTPGETTDYSEIEGYIGECCRRFAVQSLPYDPWSATQLAQRMMAQDVPMVEYPMNVSTMSEPTKFLDMIIRKHRVRHNGDPVLAWTLSNVVGHRDAKDNVYPRKQEAEAKIDPAVALIMAIGQKIVREAEGVETIYKDNELRMW